MHLAKEEKFMEPNKATIKRQQDSTSLVLHIDGQEFVIVLTDDNPNNIKSVFNSLLKQLKKGLFEFELSDENEDLYHDICTEYLAQLNSELKNIYQELKDYGLLEPDDSD